MLPGYPPRPFWFASDELLTTVLRAEIREVRQLIAQYPDCSDFFDIPEATVLQRKVCFVLLAHRELMDMIYETFAGRYTEPPSLGDEEETALSRTHNLVAPDAPAWALETNAVVELLPWRIYEELPEPLRRGGFDPNNSAELEIIRSAAETLSSLEQIQVLTTGVISRQLHRLEPRWAPNIVQAESTKEIIMQSRHQNKQKGQRKQDKQRMIRDELIAEIDEVAESLPEFLRMMDERRVKPQPTWNEWPGSWVQAYRDTRLRNLIHKDKSRALSRVRTKRNT